MNGAWNYSNMWFKNLLEICVYDDKTALSALNDDSELRSQKRLLPTQISLQNYHISQMRRQNIFKSGFNSSQIKSSQHRRT